MPYENERANPAGYSSVLNNEMVTSRLRTYGSTISMRKNELNSNLPICAVDDLEAEYRGAGVHHIIAIDGSFAAVKNLHESMEVGFIKIGVVLEKLQKLRQIARETGPINPTQMNESHENCAVETVLPGSGVIDRQTGLGEVDKLRLEVYETMQLIEIDPELQRDNTDLSKTSRMFKGDESVTLMDVLLRLSQSGIMVIQCPNCKKSNDVSIEPKNCPHCNEKTLYITDSLKLHEVYLRNKVNSSVYGEAMSVFERLLMAGLLFKASKRPEAFARTAFITDGPLALFRSGPIVPLLLEQIQDLPTPLLAGFEKTGQFVEFAHDPMVQVKLTPGSVIMVTKKVASMVTGTDHDTYGMSSFYGRRFIYKTKNGAKTFVFSLPPKEGLPSDDNNAWSNYPSLKAFCELIEETQTNIFGASAAAISSIAHANSAASIPKNLGQIMFTDLVNSGVFKTV